MKVSESSVISFKFVCHPSEYQGGIGSMVQVDGGIVGVVTDMNVKGDPMVNQLATRATPVSIMLDQQENRTAMVVDVAIVGHYQDGQFLGLYPPRPPKLLASVLPLDESVCELEDFGYVVGLGEVSTVMPIEQVIAYHIAYLERYAFSGHYLLALELIGQAWTDRFDRLAKLQSTLAMFKQFTRSYQKRPSS